MKISDRVKMIMPEICEPTQPIEKFKSLFRYFMDETAVDKIFYWDMRKYLEQFGIDFQYLWLSGKNEFVIEKITEESYWIRMKGKRKKDAIPIDKKQFFRFKKIGS